MQTKTRIIAYLVQSLLAIVTTGCLPQYHGVSLPPISSIFLPTPTPTPIACVPGWNVIDEVGETVNATANAVAIGLNNSIYAAGTTTANVGVTHWSVRASNNGTWSVADDFVYSGVNTIPNGMGFDSDSSLYVVGGTTTGTGNGEHWLVRKTSDGSSWSTVDDFQYGAVATANGFAQSANGAIFVVGYGNGERSHWVVRKSDDHGLSWTTVDDFVYSAGAPSFAQQAMVDSSGEIYVVGSGQAVTNPDFHWLTRKSVDGGTTWTTIDDYQLISGQQSYATTLSIDSSRNVFVSGEGYDGTYPHWITRRSTDHGTTWTSVDDYQNNGKLGIAHGAAVDQSGVLYTTGEGADGNTDRWVTRKSTDGGSTWATIDDNTYCSDSGCRAWAQAVTIDNDGNPIVVGHADTNSPPNSYWVVRKPDCE